VTQPLDAGARTLIVLAVIAPVSLAGPSAVAHCPTTTAVDVAGTVWVNVVFEVKVTFDVRVVVLSLVELELDFFVDLLDDLAGRTGTVPTTTNVEPETEVTLPNASEKVRFRAAAPPGIVPLGNDPLVNEPLGGRNPLAPPAPVLAAPPAPNAPPAVHDPVELGWVIATLVAVKRVEDALDFDDELLVAVTQAPTARVDEARVTVWVKRVDEVQLTVTWPLVGFCTSIEIPGTTAAMVPEAVEKAGLGIVVVVVVFLAFDAAPADPPTTATLVTRARPTAKTVDLRRDVHRGPLEAAPVNTAMSCSLFLFGSSLVTTLVAARGASATLVVDSCTGWITGLTRSGARRWATAGRPGWPDTRRRLGQWQWPQRRHRRSRDEKG
jgi:hypothetical protein